MARRLLLIRLFQQRSTYGVAIVRSAQYLVVKRGKLKQPDKHETARPVRLRLGDRRNRKSMRART
jgi:hypothetical protein